jgi:hypothetical protein
MKEKGKSRSSAWAMVNWAIIQEQIESITHISPDPESIEESLDNIEKSIPEEELFGKEAEDLEQLLITQLLKILRKRRGREIKKKQSEKARTIKAQPTQNKVDGVHIMGPFGNMGNLKDMNLDPKMMDQISKGIMDQLFGKKKKKKDSEDDDEEDDPGASFYM